MNFRLLRIRAGGDVERVLVTRDPDTASALCSARAFSCGAAVEIWDGQRCITTLPPQIDNLGFGWAQG